METLSLDNTSTLVSRILSVIEPASPIIECRIGGHYTSSNECVEVLQPKSVNCTSGIKQHFHVCII